ncbi:PilZ domain-containing protein [Butyrivibrio sp. YAB3001]|uniref:PilZ domain-containing protein n=1 Tax=Butyrivibrio sp. YAB3001 TaxID=1520812 RepID=UPI0008F67267|nr:PilZ domain-containing protein [Butyrivibrio sp. YAB3001]SFB88314.1 PilZ domain-containing protein [Butyrivibrio sp. YAB3001]
MKIYDIPQGTKITIKLVHNNSTFDVEATILTRYDKGVLVTPVFCGGELVDYCNNANFEFTEQCTGKKHVFQIDMLSRVDFSGANFHVMNGREIVIADNQRRAERYRVQIMGNAIVNKKIAMSVIVNDISLRGFSVMVNKNCKCKVGDKIKIEFLKNSMGKKMVIGGVVVRNFSIGGIDALGCEIEDINSVVLDYILEKKNESRKKKFLNFAETSAV